MTECLAAQLSAQSSRIRAAVFYPSGKGLLETGLWTADRNRPPALARERPRTTAPMTVAELREKGVPIQPLDELANMVVEGIRKGHFVMILDPEKGASTLRERAEAFARQDSATRCHELGA
jgi:hypothetical protein